MLEVFGDAERPALTDGADSGSAQRFALFAEVRRRLAGAAGPDGLLLVLDDLQWADEASAVLLTDLVRQLRGTRILVFASYRAQPGPGDETLLRLSAEANAERVELHGLAAEAIGDLLGPPGCPPLLNKSMRWPLRRVATRSWSGSWRGCSPTRAAAGPARCRDGVVDATAYRLAQASQPAQALLQTAAVAGNSFSVGVVARMLGVPVLNLLGPLDECRAAGFVVAGDHPGDYRFSHALVRSAVVARLNAEEQRRLHTKAADAIEALYEGRARLHLAEVARHRVEASLPGDRADRTRAVAACEAAADAAAEAVAFEEAVRLYRQALSAAARRSARPTGTGSSSPWPRPCTAAATCPGRRRRRSGSAGEPNAGVTGPGWPARRWRWRPRAFRNGTGRSAGSASRPWPGTIFPTTCGRGCPPGMRRRWCTGASTTGRGR